MSEITFEQWTEYQAEKAEHERQEMARFFDEFWRPIVCNPDGCINQDKLNAELWDYYTFMGTAAKVYDGITGGRVSKINTLPEAILAENEDHLQRCVREAVEDETEDLRSRIATLEGQVERAMEALEDFANSGIRHDLHPTMHEGNTATGSQVGYSVGFVYGYLDRADKSIRERAKDALQALREGGKG